MASETDKPADTDAGAAEGRSERRRKLPLDATTYALLSDTNGMLPRPGPVSVALSLRPPGLLGYRESSATHAVAVLLRHATRAGIVANGQTLRGDRVLRVEVPEEHAGLSAASLAWTLREAMTGYLTVGVPNSRVLDGRDVDTWLSLPASLLDDLAVNAVGARRTAEVEAAATLEEAMQRTLRDYGGSTEASEAERDARIRVNLTLLGEFRRRCGELGLEPDTMLRASARAVARERGRVRS